MIQYTIILKYNGKRARQLKFNRELKNFPSRNKGGWRKSLHTGVEWKLSHWTIRRFVWYLGGIFNKTITIIPLALKLVGYEMILANLALCASLAIMSLAIYHLISNVCGIIMWLVAGLQVGLALRCNVAVWVWGQQFQSPMFLGTQPPYATKGINLG